MILLTGATGNTGREIVRLLGSRGVPFRCMVRRDAAKDELERGGLTTVYGDFDQPESLEPALAGATAAYLVCTPDAGLVERESRFIEAAKAAGVGHVVKLSALLASKEAPTPNLRFHAQVEEKLVGSGVPYTLLRPNGFMQTLYFMSQAMIEAQGMMPCPAGQGSGSFVDLRDVAAAAVEVLTGSGHEGRAYDITGPEAVSFSRIAEILTGALGRPVAYVDLPEEEMAGAMAQLGVPGPAIEHVVGMFRWVREGRLAFTTGALLDLGVEATTYEQFAADLAAGKTGAATSFEPPGMPPDAGS